MSWDRYFSIGLILLAFPFFLSGNDTADYVSPVDHQIRLSGNFMEIRNNHFHAGIDIKSSNGQSGDIIRCVADGYISRIRITAGSYGNAIYIDHPLTGHTSVYAHLDRFTPEIEEYVKQVQYALQRFEVDIYLPPGIIQILQSKAIGNMGNTGHSTGPHLHFELRNTVTEKPLNPEFYGLGPGDSRPPIIEKLHVYSLDSAGYIEGSKSESLKFYNKKYNLYRSEIAANSKYVAFGLQMHDHSDASYHKNGVYGYRLYVNDSLAFSWVADTFDFSESKLLNGFIDFPTRQATGQKVYLLFKQKCNLFSGFKSKGSGIIEVEDSSYAVRIEAFDYFNNSSIIEFNVGKADNEAYPNNNYVDCDSTIIRELETFSVRFDSFHLFNPLDLIIEEDRVVIGGEEYASVKIASEKMAVSDYYTIKIVGDTILDEKWTIVKQNSWGTTNDFGLKNIGGEFISEVDELGTFVLYRDEEAPVIKALSIGQKRSPWKFQITDNLIPDGKLDNLFFKASINNQWVRMKYDLKSNLLIFEDYDKIPDGEIFFQLYVADNCGNSSVYTKSL